MDMSAPIKEESSSMSRRPFSCEERTRLSSEAALGIPASQEQLVRIPRFPRGPLPNKGYPCAAVIPRLRPDFATRHGFTAEDGFSDPEFGYRKDRWSQFAGLAKRSWR
jgi:hypothetical protein